MAATIITQEDLDQFKVELLSAIEKLLSQKQPPARRWLKSNEVRRMLLVSPGTLQHLRVTGKLPYTKIGGVIFYEHDDIQKMLLDHKRNPPRNVLPIDKKS